MYILKTRLVVVHDLRKFYRFRFVLNLVPSVLSLWTSRVTLCTQCLRPGLLTPPTPSVRVGIYYRHVNGKDYQRYSVSGRSKSKNHKVPLNPYPYKLTL